MLIFIEFLSGLENKVKHIWKNWDSCYFTSFNLHLLLLYWTSELFLTSPLSIHAWLCERTFHQAKPAHSSTLLCPYAGTHCSKSCVNRHVTTPNQGILMRFEWHTVALLPNISQLPSASLAADTGFCQLCSAECWTSPPGSSFALAERKFCWAARLSPSIQLQVFPWVMTGCRCDVSVTQTQSAQSCSRCETSAEVSGEIQLCSGQSLIDNGLWQPALRMTLSLLDWVSLGKQRRVSASWPAAVQ